MKIKFTKWAKILVVGTGFLLSNIMNAQVAAGSYIMTASHSNKVLDVPNATANDNVQLQQWEYNGSTAQQWVLESLGSNQYAIKTAVNGKALTVQNASTANGAAIILLGYSGTNNQRWTLSLVSGNTYKVVNVQSGKRLDVFQGSLNNGGLIHQWDNASVASQNWKFDLIGGASGNGSVVMEKWLNVGGTSINPFPTSTPSSTSNLTSLEIPSNTGDNYATRIKGFIIPSATGSYTFYVSGDDDVDFWLSSNNTSGSASRVAFITSGWTNSREWNKYPSQKSSAISMTAGQKYYFEVYHKEGTGGDNLAVGWTGPNISAISVIGGSNISSSTTGGGTPPTNTGCMAIGANLTGDYQWTSDGTDGRVFNSNVSNWNTVTDPWNPAFLADINATGYKALRFMDWNSTNWSRQTSWATRTPKTANHLNYGQWAGTPIAYEWMIDLCNRTNKHMWVNIPHQADANYMTQLATLIKNTLNTNLNVYVEYSNETWNGTFGDRDGMPGQYTYCIANSSALPGSNETYRSQAFHTKKSCEVFKAFNDVFGSTKSRVKKVIATYGNDDVSRHMLEMLDNTSINPNGLRPDLFAIAPYIGSGRDGSASNVVQQFKDDVNTAVAVGGIVAKFKDRLTVYNNAHPNNKMLFICYEGGSHYFGAGENPKAFYENPGSYEAYSYMLNEWKKHFNLFMQFVHRDKVDQYSAWGAKKYYGEPNSTAHKYRAIADFISTNSCAAPRVEFQDEEIKNEIITNIIKLSPNPASNKVTIYGAEKEVLILNMNGTVLASKTFDGTAIEFDLSSFNSGIYLVKTGNKVQKLIKE